MAEFMKLSMAMKIEAYKVQTPDEKHTLVFETKEAAEAAKAALEHAFQLGVGRGGMIARNHLVALKEDIRDHINDCDELLTQLECQQVSI